jgi:hypothetical protein
MKVLITLMGPSNWGLFNSLWGMIRFHDFVPDAIYILGRERDKGDFETVRKMMIPLLREYGSKADVSYEVVEGGSVEDVFDKVKKMVDAEREKGSELALDVTPGRKAAVLGSMLAGWREGKIGLFDHIFYLYIESLRNASRPFILIPLSIQHCHDIAKENRRPNDAA